MATISVKRSDAKGHSEGRAGEFSILLDSAEIDSPRSIELVMLGLGACTEATVRHYMQRKGLPTDQLGVEVSSTLNETTNAYEGFRVLLSLSDELTAAQRATILAVAKTCRIHKTLVAAPQVEIGLAPSPSPLPSGERDRV